MPPRPTATAASMGQLHPASTAVCTRQRADQTGWDIYIYVCMYVCVCVCKISVRAHACTLLYVKTL